MKELLTTELKIFYKVLYCFVAVFGLKEYKWKYRKLFFFILKVLKYLIFPLFSGVKLFFQLMRYSKTKPSKFFISFQAWETNEVLVAVHCFLLESADDLSSLPSSSEKKRHLWMYRFKYKWLVFDSKNPFHQGIIFEYLCLVSAACIKTK